VINLSINDVDENKMSFLYLQGMWIKDTERERVIKFDMSLKVC